MVDLKANVKSLFLLTDPERFLRNTESLMRKKVLPEKPWSSLTTAGRQDT